MAALTHVPVTLSPDQSPTKTAMRDIIAAFFPKEWPFVDPETLTLSYSTTFANPHCKVERAVPITGTAIEPLKLLIKFHNDSMADMEVFKHLVPTKQEEALISLEFGRSGLGAKVYGFFKTEDGTLGRIDEFIDGRGLKPEDVEDSGIQADIARGLARFHTLDFDLDGKEVTGRGFSEALVQGLRRYQGMKKLEEFGRHAGVDIDRLIDYDFATAVEEVVEKLESLNAKKAWCIHDVQYGNIIVRNHPQPGKSKTVLVDFEFAMRNFRAFDIGGHFMQKIFDWYGQDSKIVNCREYLEEERRYFCDEYAREWNIRTGDSDTGDEVFVEAEYGVLLAVAFDVHNMLCAMEEEGGDDPLSLLGLNELYGAFVKQFNKLDGARRSLSGASR
ncbi:choline/ethanolamine kinase [Cercophora newfieldiana]|uniref:Choline/ethanolamine kinase n=1 Tax=Cercophora newfieldiana TaxID=92897 RepID=A0AA39YI72_9PEZI|nr:choline/ethanolamine kinase [Cercophora newfieldiana]